ncbi:MAG: hypothetical protein WCK28_15970 [Burkholderiales bacterium]|jgi:surface polysaccharide O-acyltransferase-like enzyme
MAEIERQKPVYTNPNVGNGLLIFGAVVFVAFIYCAWRLATGEANKPIARVIGAAWVVSVPVFFFVEHIYFFRKYGDPAQFDQFKRLQDLAAKIWAAAAVVLGAFAVHGFPGKTG